MKGRVNAGCSRSIQSSEIRYQRSPGCTVGNTIYLHRGAGHQGVRIGNKGVQALVGPPPSQSLERGGVIISWARRDRTSGHSFERGTDPVFLVVMTSATPHSEDGSSFIQIPGGNQPDDALAVRPQYQSSATTLAYHITDSPSDIDGLRIGNTVASQPHPPDGSAYE